MSMDESTQEDTAVTYTLDSDVFERLASQSHGVCVVDVVVSIHTDLVCIFPGIFQNLHDTIGQSDETYGMHALS